jgi:hypothetical protein
MLPSIIIPTLAFVVSTISGTPLVAEIIARNADALPDIAAAGKFTFSYYNSRVCQGDSRVFTISDRVCFQAPDFGSDPIGSVRPVYLSPNCKGRE